MALKILSQLKSLPKNQRVALGAGAVGATGFGLYSYRKRKAAGTTTKPAAAAATPAGAQSTLTPTSPDLSQYAVLVPINWQDGANFGGSGGLTGPLTPGAPVTTPPPTPGPTPSAPAVPPPAVPVAAMYTALNDQQLAASRPTTPTPQQIANAPQGADPHGLRTPAVTENNFNQLGFDAHGNPVTWSTYTTPGSPIVATVHPK